MLLLALNYQKLQYMVEMMRDPAWQFLGFSIAFIGIALTCWFFWLQRQIKELAFGTVSSQRLLSVSNELSSRVKVELDGKAVSNVHLIVFALKNSGHRAIRAEEFPEGFSIVFTEGKVFSAEIASQIPTNLRAEIRFTETAAILKPLLLNAGDQLLIQVLVSSAEPKFEADARVEDISEFKPINTNPKSPPIMQSGLPWIFGFFAVFGLITYLSESHGFSLSSTGAPEKVKDHLPMYKMVLGVIFFGIVQVTGMRLYEKYSPSGRRFIKLN